MRDLHRPLVGKSAGHPWHRGHLRGPPRKRQAAEIPRPTLDDVHDGIIDGEWESFHGAEKPLFHFGPQRFDIACARIEHYTGIEVETLQRFILFTNYDMHTTEFVDFGLSELTREDARYTDLLLPGRQISRTPRVSTPPPRPRFPLSDARYDLCTRHGTASP